MRRVAICLAVLCAGGLLVPAMASAQTGIAGVVKDTTGAVMPGVTVEASSPALIEKTRSVVTDSAGQYKIVDLQPGHLRGHVHARRVQGGAARQHHARGQRSRAQVNADLQVGRDRRDADGHRRIADRGRRSPTRRRSSRTARCSTRFRRPVRNTPRARC